MTTIRIITDWSGRQTIQFDNEASEIYRQAYAEECPNSPGSLFEETSNRWVRDISRKMSYRASNRQQYEVVERGYDPDDEVFYSVYLLTLSGLPSLHAVRDATGGPHVIYNEGSTFSDGEWSRTVRSPVRFTLRALALADPEEAVGYFRNWLRDDHCPPPSGPAVQNGAESAGTKRMGGSNGKEGVGSQSGEAVAFLRENWFSLLLLGVAVSPIIVVAPEAAGVAAGALLVVGVTEYLRLNSGIEDASARF